MNRLSGMCTQIMVTYLYSKTCVKRPLNIDKTNSLMANGSLMKVESIGAFCKKGSPTLSDTWS